MTLIDELREVAQRNGTDWCSNIIDRAIRALEAAEGLTVELRRANDDRRKAESERDALKAELTTRKDTEIEFNRRGDEIDSLLEETAALEAQRDSFTWQVFVDRRALLAQYDDLEKYTEEIENGSEAMRVERDALKARCEELENECNALIERLHRLAPYQRHEWSCKKFMALPSGGVYNSDELKKMSDAQPCTCGLSALSTNPLTSATGEVGQLGPTT